LTIAFSLALGHRAARESGSGSTRQRIVPLLTDAGAAVSSAAPDWPIDPFRAVSGFLERPVTPASRRRDWRSAGCLTR